LNGNISLEGKIEVKPKDELDRKEQMLINMISEKNKQAHLLTEYVIEERLPALLIASMQFTIAISTEIVSLLMINGQREIFDVIVNFIAIKVIAEIDNIFFAGITDMTLLKLTESHEGEDWTPKRIYNKIKFSQREFLEKVLFSIYKLVKLAYNSLYFYFFPFLVILFNIISRRCEDIYNPQVEMDDGKGVIRTEFLCEHLEVFYIKRIFTNSFFRK
jgi:hypothetical protein